jgi:hypothetical protein
MRKPCSVWWLATGGLSVANVGFGVQGRDAMLTEGSLASRLSEGCAYGVSLLIRVPQLASEVRVPPQLPKSAGFGGLG